MTSLLEAHTRALLAFTARRIGLFELKGIAPDDNACLHTPRCAKHSHLAGSSVHLGRTVRASSQSDHGRSSSNSPLVTGIGPDARPARRVHS